MSDHPVLPQPSTWVLLGWGRVWLALPQDEVTEVRDDRPPAGRPTAPVVADARPCVALDGRLQPATAPGRPYAVFLSGHPEAPGILCEEVDRVEAATLAAPPVLLPPILTGDHPGMGLLAPDTRRVALIADAGRLAAWLHPGEEGTTDA